MKGGTLVRDYKVGPFAHSSTVAVIPESLKLEMLCQAHDDAAHQGIERTLSRLKSMVYWVGMIVDVEKYVASCEICQKAKLLRPVKAPLQNNTDPKNNAIIPS